MPIDRSL